MPFLNACDYKIYNVEFQQEANCNNNSVDKHDSFCGFDIFKCGMSSGIDSSDDNLFKYIKY